MQTTANDFLSNVFAVSSEGKVVRLRTMQAYVLRNTKKSSEAVSRGTSLK